MSVISQQYLYAWVVKVAMAENIMETSESSTTIEIDDRFRPWLDDAVLRFRYLHPNVELDCNEGRITLHGKAVNDPVVKRDFLFGLYRQKIYAETLPLRQILIEGVTGFASRTA